MNTALKIKDLIGQDLKDFKIVEMTEVYEVNCDGRYLTIIGFFKDQNIAQAFVEVQPSPSYYQLRQVWVLTDGTVGYTIAQEDPIKLFDDKAEALKIQKKIIAKLSATERKFLGLE